MLQSLLQCGAITTERVRARELGATNKHKLETRICGLRFVPTHKKKILKHIVKRGLTEQTRYILRVGIQVHATDQVRGVGDLDAADWLIDLVIHATGSWELRPKNGLWTRLESRYI